MDSHQSTTPPVNDKDDFVHTASEKHLKVILLGITTLLVLVAIGIGGYYLGLSNNIYQKSPIVMDKIIPTSTGVPVTEKSTYINNIMMEKDIEGGRFIAKRLCSSDIFKITLESGEYPSTIYSVLGDYNQDGVFDVVGDQLWVVNQQTNTIDTYTYQTEKRNGMAIQPSSLIYKDSISMPKYQVGGIYSVKCQDTICKISTAFHQEAGCVFELNTDTLIYSVPECYSPGPEGFNYTPEKI